MDGVVIGLDPHKRSVSIEVRDDREVLRATGRFATDTVEYRAMLRFARQWPVGRLANFGHVISGLFYAAERVS
jgi:hypothetical protein